MEHARKIKIIKEGKESNICYYVKRKGKSQFGCVMYNVGIKTESETKEIDDFSPSLEEAIGLCDYLYHENVSAGNLFLAAEEFIVTL